MDRLDILKMNVKQVFKQIGHNKQVGQKKKNLEPVKEETLETKSRAHDFTLQERILSYQSL